MQIDIEGFLKSNRLIPVGGAGWNTFEVEHFGALDVADADRRIEDIRASIQRKTGGVYVYHNANSECIYVGKSQDLRDRFRVHYRRANRRGGSGDEYDRHFNFWSARTGKLKVSWYRIEREEDRQIIEIMLTFYLRPKFCEIPRYRP